VYLVKDIEGGSAVRQVIVESAPCPGSGVDLACQWLANVAGNSEGPLVAKEFISVELTRGELRLVTEAVSELIYEYEHNVDPPSRRGGTERPRHPDTSELRRLASRPEQLLG
jgi:hypothetical protein